ncbi:hypothetical protein CLOP_g22260 [Closterium sp. NIES-67]|nr:hypothetical protein CLOP_g22260 [Closterium sp. NIES-67]
MLQKLVKDGSLKGLEVKGGVKEIGSCPTCLETKFSKHKYGPEGELTRYKSRLVARGFQQTKGKDYDEVFAPVGKGTTLRVLLAIAALLGWKIRQMDIVTAFLNGIILEEVYMKQPEGLDDGSGRVCRLKKAIYGLKQAPRAWYHKLEEALLAGGFKKNVVWSMMVGSQRGRLLCDVIICYHILSASHLLFQFVFVMIDLEKIFPTQQESLQSEQECESYEDSKLARVANLDGLVGKGQMSKFGFL